MAKTRNTSLDSNVVRNIQVGLLVALLLFTIILFVQYDNMGPGADTTQLSEPQTIQQ